MQIHKKDAMKNRNNINEYVNEAIQKMANKTGQSEPFRMTGTECAEFIHMNRKKIAARLRGKRDENEDAIEEVTCKCLQVKNGYGTLLKWNDDPFVTART